MAITDTIRQMLPPVDPRTPQQVNCDIDDEFAFHLTMLEAEERAAGRDADSAKRIAHKRFGNVAKWRARCRRIALKERIMLQRINIAMTIVLLLIVIGVGVQVFVTQRYNTLALQDITTQLSQMKLEAIIEQLQNTPAVGARAELQDDAVAREIDYDMRNLVGIWRLVSAQEVPNELAYLFVNDSSAGPPEGFVKRSASPASRFDVPAVQLHFSLNFERRAIRSDDSSAAVRLSISPSSPGQSYQRPSIQLSIRWQPRAEDRIAIYYESVLRHLTPEMSQVMQPWLEQPLIYERVTAAYTDRLANGPPQHMHVLGVGDKPQRFDLPKDAELTVQDVLNRVGFAEMEDVQARWIMYGTGRSSGGTIRPKYMDPSYNYGPFPLSADAVIIVSESKDESERTPAPNRDTSIGDKPSAAAALPTPTTVVVRGHVQRPGAYAVSTTTSLTLARAVAAAGGATADDAHVLLLQAKDRRWILDYDATLGAILNDPSRGRPLTGGEIVHVLDRKSSDFEAELTAFRDARKRAALQSPGSGGVVYLQGDVERSGVFNLPRNGELTVSRILAAAGMNETDDPRQLIMVRRQSDGDDLTVLDMSLAEFLTDRLTHDVVVQPNDLITVRATQSDND